MTKEEIGRADVQNGVASTTYVIPSTAKVGDHTIYGTYIENDTYQTAEDSATYSVRIGTKIEVDNVLANSGETCKFVAHVYYNETQPVVGDGTAFVQFMLGGVNIGSPVQLGNGEAEYNYTLPSSITSGTEITAVFTGNDTYGASTTISAGILTLRENPTVTVDSLSANYGTTANITAHVSEADGGTVTVGTGLLYIDDVQNGSEVTIDSTGTLTFPVSISNSFTAGTHTIKVVYQLNDEYNTAEATGTLTVRAITSIELSSFSVNPSGIATLQATVTTDNASVPTGAINFIVNGETYTATVTASGIATYNYQLPSDASGTIEYSAEYVENVNYQGSTSTSNGVITIRKAVTITVQEVSANIGDEVALTASVVDGNSNAITIGEVVYTIEES